MTTVYDFDALNISGKSVVGGVFGNNSIHDGCPIVMDNRPRFSIVASPSRARQWFYQGYAAGECLCSNTSEQVMQTAGHS